MNTQLNDSNSAARRDYAKPDLRRYGTLQQLTHAGSGQPIAESYNPSAMQCSNNTNKNVCIPPAATSAPRP